MTKTKEPKSLLERWAVVVEIVTKQGCAGPKGLAFPEHKSMGVNLDVTKGMRYGPYYGHDEESDRRVELAATALLEKWFRDDVASWWRSVNADSECRSLHEPRWNAHRDWHYWHVFVCDLNHDGTHKFKESNTHTDGSEAHIACAEAMVRSLEAFHE